MRWKRYGKSGWVLNNSERRRKNNIKINYIILTPEKTVYPANTAISFLKITVNVYVKDDKEGTLNILIDGNSIKKSNVSKSGDYEVTTSISAKASGEKVKISAEVKCEDKISSSEIGILFIGNIYSGGNLFTDEITAEEIKKNPAVSKETSAGTYEYSTNDELGRFVYAYPTALRKITKITDETGLFDYSNSVTRKLLMIDNCEYEVIYLTDAMIFENLKIKFE